MSLQCLAIWLYSGCLAEILQFEGRFSEVLSRMNCVSVSSVGSESRPWCVSYVSTRLSRSGSNLCLVSAVALHLVRIWDRSSSGGWCCGLASLVQRRQ